MARKLFLFAIGLFLVSSLPAQSWKKLRNTADDQFEAGDYAEAAENYEAAWRKKQNRSELIFQAGEAYYLLRDYRKAAEAYRSVKDEYNDYPLAGLKYARSLKQDGQCDQSIQAFREFSQNYTGQGKAILEEIIRTEIRGCEMLGQLAANPDPNAQVSLLGLGVNSDANEFAPLSFSNDVLYFSSTMGGKARIYRSQRLATGWAKASIPENFPVIQEDHFAHGTLTPDGSRFYFTICGSDATPFNNLSTRCEIYAIKRLSGTWSQPERLPNTVNLDGTTATQPFVVHQGGTEYLYFSSNRGGGRGGLDLWYSTRDLSTDNTNFSNPVNLGPTINTLGDEMAPFMDPRTGMFYFASNGHVTVGGFDIFRSQGSGTSWSIPENVGMPYNSSADDFYYTLKDDGTGGYLASNRVFAGDKLTTRHDDIFEFTTSSFRPQLQASVFDRKTNQLVNNFTVTVYEVDPSRGEENLLYNRPFTGGSYSFDLPPNNTFRIEVAGPGFEPASYTVSTTDPSVTNYGQSLFLDPTISEPVAAYPQPNVPPNTNVPPATPATLDNSGALYTSRGMAPGDTYEFTTAAPRYEGTYYKVQIVALRRYNPETDRFATVSRFGQQVNTEYVIEKSLNRVLVGPYFTEPQAREALQQIRSNGGFPKAFLVRYVDGQRYGQVTF